MSIPLALSIMTITLALIFYSVGVWVEHLARRLLWWHLFFFWLGLSCDTVGTGIMADLAGGLSYDLHGITGIIAIILMFIHAIWATFVILRKNERALTHFHKFSIGVWIVWLIPYSNGFFLAM